MVIYMANRCVHPKFHFQLHVTQIENTHFRCVEIFAQCCECAEVVTFQNLKAEQLPGTNYVQPSMTPSGSHAFLPFVIGDPIPSRVN